MPRPPKLPAPPLPSALKAPPEIVLNVPGVFGINTNHLGDFDRGDFTIRENLTALYGPHELHFGTWRLGTVNSYTESSWAALVVYEIVANSTVLFRHFGQRQGNGRSLDLAFSSN